MPTFEPYLILFCIVLVVNAIPILMPPTWIVLSILTVQYHLLPLPTILVGVVAALSGRVILALVARHFSRYFTHRKFFKNYKHLGTFLAGHQHITIPIILAYTFSPISSASLFIMAGLAQMRLLVLVIAFIIGRLVSYSFWVFTSHHVAGRLEDIFAHNLTRHNAILSVVISIVLIFLVGQIPWPRLIPLSKKKR